MVNGEPWFVAKDISDVLEFRDTANALRSLEDCEKDLHIVETLGGDQSMTRSEKGTSNVGTLGEIQSIQELESSAKGECKAPTLGTTQSIQRLEDLEKGVGLIYTLDGDQSTSDLTKGVHSMDTLRGEQSIPDSMRGVTSMNSLGGNQSMTIVAEAEMYKLVFTSREPHAEAFTNWVVSEVLPAIRKTGSYSAVTTESELPTTFSPALYLAAKQQEKIEEQHVRLVSSCAVLSTCS
ncbi:Bro-N domain-containing protein [Candidatus Cryosericum septentrionale]|jgi:prophage antirepressor-like protein|nr:BRO family protein [Candidatus Cryosericum septentrionale]